MSINYKKDKTGLVALKKLFIPFYADHYYLAHLWASQEAMLANAPSDMEVNKNTGAYCCHAHYWLHMPDNGPASIRGPRRVGEIHFVKGDWSLQFVAHECSHATNHLCRILQIRPMEDIEYEERAAYILGGLTDECYRWLWEVDRPKGRWWRNFRNKIKNWLAGEKN